MIITQISMLSLRKRKENKMKKALSFILALVVVFSLGTTAFAAEANISEEFNPDAFFRKAQLVSYDGTTAEFKTIETSGIQEKTSTVVAIAATTPEETISLKKSLAKRGVIIVKYGMEISMQNFI